MNKKTLLKTLIAILFIIVMGFLYFSWRSSSTIKVSSNTNDPKNATYTIDGQKITLINGVSEISPIQGAASKITTKYFGNSIDYDLNNDGKLDNVFLLTQSTGGSGVFYYVVGAINTVNGYIGSDGYYLGDRIAPQTINNSQNPIHKNVIVVNYADRAQGEPMTTQPSIGKSVYLKMDENNRWGIVEADFQGEFGD